MDNEGFALDYPLQFGFNQAAKANQVQPGLLRCTALP